MSAEAKTLTNQLEALRRHSVIVADTGDIDAIARFRPQDATTNPSLILKAAREERYRRLIDAAIAAVPGRGGDESRIGSISDYLFVAFGQEILRLVPSMDPTKEEPKEAKRKNVAFSLAQTADQWGFDLEPPPPDGGAAQPAQDGGALDR